MEGEAGVLVQAILSIKSIIRQDPLSHEKVFFFSNFNDKLFHLFLMFTFHLCLASLIIQANL